MAQLLSRLRLAGCAFALLACAGCDGGGGTAADAGTDAGTDTDTDTDVDTDSDSDADSDAGPDGGGYCDRGDPADFPTGCLASCEEACARLDECGGADAPGCPLSPEQCAFYCQVGFEGGHSWGDVSGHFRCCTAQEECADVAGCGGWLSHPDAEAPCTEMCECWDALHDWGAMGSTQTPPAGYGWAPDAVALSPDAETVDYLARYGTPVVARGGVEFVRAEGSREGRVRLAERLARDEIPLPTFVDGAGRLAAATGSIVIEAASPAAIRAAGELVAARGFAAVRELAWSRGSLRVAEGGDPWGALDVLAELNAIPGVLAELDMIRIYEKQYTPDDPLFPDQWHLRNQGQDDPAIADGPQLAVSGADGRVAEAWDVEDGAPETVIAILDDGVNLHHPDLAPNLTAEPYNFPESWEDYMGEPYAGDVIASHGTCCAGVAAAAADNGTGVAGVCPHCTLLPGLIWDQTIYPDDPEASLPMGSTLMMTDTALAGWVTDLVDLGAAIISNSWGYGGEDPYFESEAASYPSLPAVVSDAFDYAETDGRGGLGTIIVFAAGNSNMDIADDPYLSHPNVVGVAASDDQGLKAFYSSYGEHVDVAAPSNHGLLGITTTAQSADAASDPHYDYEFGGTSSATPFVAGALGLILSANPALTAADARQILADSATAIDPVWGEWADGFSPYYGHGLVDAYRAVQMANGTCADAATCFAPSDVCATGCDGTACAACRTDNDCADGWVCQALPALGETVCVEAVATTTCGADFEYANGYCLPTRAACGLCDAEEVCNGRDDDCDGAVDEELTDCAEAGRCLQQGWGCADGEVCAATYCTGGTLCADAATDCAAGELCVHVKTRYGDVEPEIGVCQSAPLETTCFDRCLPRDSSGLDEEMAAFAECTSGLADNCTDTTLEECRDLLPDGDE
jgi:subtilisin family serine protease